MTETSREELKGFFLLRRDCDTSTVPKFVFHGPGRKIQNNGFFPFSFLEESMFKTLPSDMDRERDSLSRREGVVFYLSER